MLIPKRDRIQTAGVVFLIAGGLGACGFVLFILIRAAQIAHVQF